jgi:hypothetical protein
MKRGREASFFVSLIPNPFYEPGIKTRKGGCFSLADLSNMSLLLFFQPFIFICRLSSNDGIANLYTLFLAEHFPDLSFGDSRIITKRFQGNIICFIRSLDFFSNPACCTL